MQNEIWRFNDAYNGSNEMGWEFITKHSYDIFNLSNLMDERLMLDVFFFFFLGRFIMSFDYVIQPEWKEIDY